MSNIKGLYSEVKDAVIFFNLTMNDMKESSMYQVHPAPTPPSSDLEDCINNVPGSYYSLSPPDMASNVGRP